MSTVLRVGLAPLAAALLVLYAPGGSTGEPAATEVELDEVLVIGELPGPAMWRVSKGDHTLWIMGTLSPLPSKMTWRQRQVEEVIKASGEILGDSDSDLDMDLGFWEGVGLLRSALKLRHNADGATLREVLPDQVYQRWHAAHLRWFGKNPDRKERARPIYAAALLYEQALKKSGLSHRPMVWSTVKRVAGQHKVKIRQRQFSLKVEDPHGMLAELTALPRDKEAACLVETMDYIERELPDLKRRAQAWATGDMATLRALPRGEEQPACMEVGQGTQLQSLIKQEEELFRKDWAGIVDWLLLTHDTSFTLLPVKQLLDQDGVLAQLRSKGYTVEEPQ